MGGVDGVFDSETPLLYFLLHSSSSASFPTFCIFAIFSPFFFFCANTQLLFLLLLFFSPFHSQSLLLMLCYELLSA